MDVQSGESKEEEVVGKGIVLLKTHHIIHQY